MVHHGRSLDPRSQWHIHEKHGDPRLLVPAPAAGESAASLFALWVHPPPDSTLLWPEETLQQVRGEEEGRALPLLAPVP